MKTLGASAIFALAWWPRSLLAQPAPAPIYVTTHLAPECYGTSDFAQRLLGRTHRLRWAYPGEPGIVFDVSAQRAPGGFLSGSCKFKNWAAASRSGPYREIPALASSTLSRSSLPCWLTLKRPNMGNLLGRSSPRRRHHCHPFSKRPRFLIGELASRLASAQRRPIASN